MHKIYDFLGFHHATPGLAHLAAWRGRGATRLSITAA
jgi:hypothetical protein